VHYALSTLFLSTAKKKLQEYFSAAAIGLGLQYNTSVTYYGRPGKSAQVT